MIYSSAVIVSVCLEARLKATAEAAVIRFGSTSQLNQLQEECCELSVEISHMRRGRGDPRKLAEELADVIIMTEQARFIVPRALLEEELKRKLDSLERRIEE